jgi:hypothetical protein
MVARAWLAEYIGATVTVASARHSSRSQSHELEQRASGFTGLWVHSKAVSNREHVTKLDGRSHRANSQASA